MRESQARKKVHRCIVCLKRPRQSRRGLHQWHWAWQFYQPVSCKFGCCRRRILAKKGLRVATVRENDWKSLDDQKEFPRTTLLPCLLLLCSRCLCRCCIKTQAEVCALVTLAPVAVLLLCLLYGTACSDSAFCHRRNGGT